MLLEMSIRNLAVIEAVHLHFRKGFHVLTGETGAGKSIIIDALTLIAGGEAQPIWFDMGVIKRPLKPCSRSKTATLCGIHYQS